MPTPADAAPKAPASSAVIRATASTGPKSGAKAKKKAARGWGPYKSVARERSVDFNLTLDVQSLQQEIRELATLRDLLQTQALNRRHERDGSFVKTVREFYRLFHHGYWLPSTHSDRGRRHSYRLDTMQREFLASVMAHSVDIGGGFSGFDLMIEQMAIYSTCFRDFRVEMRHLDIAQAEDSVIITTHTDFHFRIARKMVELVFPHIRGNERLMSQLIGRRVVCDMRITFVFGVRQHNGFGREDGDHGECVRYTVDVDYVSVFAEILRDIRATELLVSRARITSNSMLAIEPNAHADGARQAV
jgi:hypothetical protein